MKKENKVALKTMAMKSRVANMLRTEVYPYSHDEYEIKYKGKKKLKDQDKIDIFNKIYAEIIKMNNELTAYKNKRKSKTIIEKLRQEKKNLILAK